MVISESEYLNAILARNLTDRALALYSGNTSRLRHTDQTFLECYPGLNACTVLNESVVDLNNCFRGTLAPDQSAFETHTLKVDARSGRH